MRARTSNIIRNPAADNSSTGENFDLVTARQASSHTPRQPDRFRNSGVTTLSHRIAKDSPSNCFGNSLVSDDCAPSRQSQRIVEALDSVQLTQTSALAGFRPVPRVRMSPSPPGSLNCREFLSLFLTKYPKHARISRLFHDKPDCRERTTH